MKEQLKAEAYVLSQRPALMELSFGTPIQYEGTLGIFCTVANSMDEINIHLKGSATSRKVLTKDVLIIGHRPQLNDWLAVLGRENHPHKRIVSFNHDTCSVDGINFNLTTGQPDNEAAYKTFNDTVGI